MGPASQTAAQETGNIAAFRPSYGASTPTEGPPHSSPVDEAIRQLDTAIDMMGNRVISLSGRLEPIIRSEETNSKDSVDPRVPAAQLVSQINDRTFKIVKITEIVEALIKGLQI